MQSDRIPITPSGHLLNAISDSPDSRDLYYQPALKKLATSLEPDYADLQILDQHQEGACTGFGLAAVINLLNKQRGNDNRVSARMLYNMAQKFDRWPGEAYPGSSCRGAIHGWKNMGVCSDALWPYEPGDRSELTIEQAKDARNNTIGAYYRLMHRIVDFHAALNEVGAIYVSANVHPGWWPERIKRGKIPLVRETSGGHAFAIVGYNEQGFLVQNSWGPGWGDQGLALWSYEDWQANIKDAWVVRLALPTPQIFPGVARSSGYATGDNLSLFKKRPSRSEIAGHFVHIDDGNLHDSGRYWSKLSDLRQTAKLVAKSTDYDHLLFYAHGGLNSIYDSARRIRAMKKIFKKNRIYPLHFMYDTGLLEEIKDVLINRYREGGERVAGFTDFTDRLLESTTRKVGRALWREMKNGARLPFSNNSRGGLQTVKTFLDALNGSDNPKQIHLLGHSTGGILLAWLLEALQRSGSDVKVASCNLLAPAATLDLFNKHFLPELGGRIGKMRIYNLSEALELDDHVAQIYRKSLLYLVSNAFEEAYAEQLLGLQRDAKTIAVPDQADFKIIVSQGDKGRERRSRSESHGGFDNDIATMNDILKTILGRRRPHKFTEDDLKY
ncbi:MAG: C1 family peptidase [Gammaproteobacteria bacterium]|nr:C1 family peptidase [Gammaproteobacteria bacterium]